MNQPPLSDQETRPASPAPQWAQQLLDAEMRWMQPHLEGLERFLWLSPVSATATDADPSALLLAASAGGLTGPLRTALASWPLLDDTLEAVVIQHPLEIGLPLEALCEEAMRVLKPEALLWVIASGSASFSRFRLASALGAGVRWPSAFRAGAFSAAMGRGGAVDLEFRALAFDSQLAALSTMSRALPWAPVVVAQARKRRSANILRPRALRSLQGARVSGLPALPASRVGIAA